MALRGPHYRGYGDDKYVVIVDVPGTDVMGVVSGWEYKEDANDHKSELKDGDLPSGSTVKVMTGKSAKNKGIPDAGRRLDAFYAMRAEVERKRRGLPPRRPAPKKSGIRGTRLGKVIYPNSVGECPSGMRAKRKGRRLICVRHSGKRGKYSR